MCYSPRQTLLQGHSIMMRRKHSTLKLHRTFRFLKKKLQKQAGFPIVLLLLALITLWGSFLAIPIAQAKTKPLPSLKPHEKPLRVAAAADLTDAFQDIKIHFEKTTGIHVELIWGASGLLTSQIENGAPYDVFAAADVSFINRLRRQNLILPNSQKAYAQGRIVIAIPINSSTAPKTLYDLTHSPQIKRVGIADPEFAPYGKAAKEALQHQHLWRQIRPKLVYGKNIRDTLSLLQSGNIDAAIIARSLANPHEIHFYPIPASLYTPLNQSIAIPTTSKQKDEAKAFVAYVISRQGQYILQKYGFAVPGDKAWGK